MGVWGERGGMERIRDRAERTKIALSSREQGPFNVPFVTMTPQGQPLNIDFVFTRRMLEEMTAPLVDRSLEILRRGINDAKLEGKKGDELFVGGGQTPMPILQMRLTRIFRKSPTQDAPPS